MSFPRKEIFENSGCTVLSRVLGHNGEPIVRADISTITCKVRDLTSDTAVASPAVTVNSAAFNALQTDDPRWDADSEGFNFEHSLPASAFPTEHHDDAIQYTF